MKTNEEILKEIRDKIIETCKENKFNFDEVNFVEIDGKPCIIIGDITYYNIQLVAIESEQNPNELEITFVANKSHKVIEIENKANTMLEFISDYIEAVQDPN